MPQATTLAIQDGAATPVTHSFTPGRVADLAARFQSAQGSTILASREILEVKLREASGTTPAKVSIKLSMPIEGTVNGQQVVTRQYLGGVDFVISPTGTEAERKARRVLLANVLLNADVAKTIDQVEAFF